MLLQDSQSLCRGKALGKDQERGEEPSLGTEELGRFWVPAWLKGRVFQTGAGALVRAGLGVRVASGPRADRHWELSWDLQGEPLGRTSVSDTVAQHLRPVRGS